jgi:hypothetical protein
MSHPLAREVAFWLGVKVVALAALFFLFFGPAQRPTVTPANVGELLAAPDAAPADSPESPADE